MIYILTTKKGMGVEIWGNYDDLCALYEVIQMFWNDENYSNKEEFDNRDDLISSFSYEIRKAKDGSRLKKERSHYSLESHQYYSTQLLWVHILFSLTALKYNMRFYETNKLDIAIVLQLEFWLEKAMNIYDETGAKELIGFIDGGLYGANPYIYQCMRSINLEYFQLGGGKRAFRKLSQLLKKGVYYTQEYKDYENLLKKEAARLNIPATDLELIDDDIDYESIKW